MWVRWAIISFFVLKWNMFILKKKKKIIVANWKMNPKTAREAVSIFNKIRTHVFKLKNTKVVICPPAVFLNSFSFNKKSKSFALGAQDVFYEQQGAFTGKISPLQLRDAGANHVILGHSEMRASGETGEIIAKKIGACIKYLITPIVCVGEINRDEEGRYMALLRNQIHETFIGIPKTAIRKIVIAYEPVWAIGKDALREVTTEEARETIIFIRKVLSEIFDHKLCQNATILYGGSVSAKNAQEFLQHSYIDGFLVGRASLDPKEFIEILKTAEKVQ